MCAAILDRGDIELFGMTLDTQSFEANTTQGYDLWFDYALSKNPSTMFMIGAPWPDFPRDYNTTNYTAIVREKYLPTLDGVFASLRAKVREPYSPSTNPSALTLTLVLSPYNAQR